MNWQHCNYVTLACERHSGRAAPHHVTAQTRAPQTLMRESLSGRSHFRLCIRITFIYVLWRCIECCDEAALNPDPPRSYRKKWNSKKEVQMHKPWTSEILRNEDHLDLYESLYVKISSPSKTRIQRPHLRKRVGSRLPSVDINLSLGIIYPPLRPLISPSKLII